MFAVFAVVHVPSTFLPKHRYLPGFTLASARRADMSKASLGSLGRVCSHSHQDISFILSPVVPRWLESQEDFDKPLWQLLTSSFNMSVQ